MKSWKCAATRYEIKNPFIRAFYIQEAVAVYTAIHCDEWFLQGARTLLPDAVHAFRIVSFVFLFAGIAIFSSAFFTALNNGLISALIAFLRTFVFELGAVLLLPLLLGVDGIWCSVVFAELMAAIAGSILMAVSSKKNWGKSQIV